MDSKIAFLNLASDYYRSNDQKIFLNKNEPVTCKSCSKSYYFIDKKYNYCNKCFLNNCCTISFHDNNFIIKMKDTNVSIFQENISILSNKKDKNIERTREINNNNTSVLKSTYV